MSQRRFHMPTSVSPQRWVRVACSTLLADGVAESIAQAQVADTVLDKVDLDITRWAITQGGLALVTLVLFWSYRRDFKTVLANQEDKVQVLTCLVRDTQMAITDAANAKRELTQAIMLWRGTGTHQ